MAAPHKDQDYLDALAREKEGYERRAAASDDKDEKARMTDRAKQVDAEVARVKKAPKPKKGEPASEEGEAPAEDAAAA